MSVLEETNIAVVRRYFDGCNSGKLEDLLPTLAPDVVHYFLPPSLPTIHGAEHLAKYWRKFNDTCRPLWRIDEIIGQGDRVVSRSFLLWDDTTHCSRTVSSFWREPLLGTPHFQPKQAIEGANFSDSAG
jgi:SnoaL-like domain